MADIRIKLKNLHNNQKKILEEARRFNVLKCGRRFGKTELTKELAIQPALDGFPVGYWCPVYKDLSNVWDELNTTLLPIIAHKDSQLKKLKLITGGSIDMWSMEDPNSGRGFKYKRVIIDEAEKARHLKSAWEQTIRATLVDYKGDAYFMSTPQFGQTYFKETLFKNYIKYPEEWMSWRFTSFDNPFLDPKEIEEARRYDELVFRCEYLAEDVDISLRPFAYCFDESKHVVDELEYNPELELMISFDFNVDPITAVAAQHDGETIYFIKSFKLQNSNIYELCDQIQTEYAHLNPLYLVTGDATGRARSAITVGNLNYYRVIKEKLRIGDQQLKVPRVNPAISDSRVLLNSLFQNYNIKISRKDCEPLIYDLKYVEVDEQGDMIKDRSTDKRNADQMDCCRYLLSTFFSWFIKLSAHYEQEIEY